MLETQHSPVIVNDFVKSLRGKRVDKVSCGCSHTILVTERQNIVKENQGDLTNEVIGGEVFVAGSSVALGKFTPKFHKMKEIASKPMKDVSAGVR